MADKLSIKFNAKCFKDFKVGKRKTSDGTINYWQGNKLVAVEHPKMTMFLDAGREMLHRHREDPRVSKMRVNPELLKIHAKPGM
jgi:hypothetical protein